MFCYYLYLLEPNNQFKGWGVWVRREKLQYMKVFQLDGFLWWFLGLWTTYSCRETFVTNLFTDGPINSYLRTPGFNVGKQPNRD